MTRRLTKGVGTEPATLARQFASTFGGERKDVFASELKRLPLGGRVKALGFKKVYVILVVLARYASMSHEETVHFFAILDAVTMVTRPGEVTRRSARPKQLMHPAEFAAGFIRITLVEEIVVLRKDHRWPGGVRQKKVCLVKPGAQHTGRVLLGVGRKLVQRVAKIGTDIATRRHH